MSTIVQHERVKRQNREEKTQYDLQSATDIQNDAAFDVRFSTFKQEETINDHTEINQNENQVMKASKFEPLQSNINNDDDFFKCKEKDGLDKNSKVSEETKFD